MATRVAKIVNRTITCKRCGDELQVKGPRKNSDLVRQLNFSWEYHYYGGTGWYSEGWRCPKCHSRKNLWRDI